LTGGGIFQYIETFIDVVFDGVEYIPGDEEQSLLLTHGLIKADGKEVRVEDWDNCPVYGVPKTRPRRYFLASASNSMKFSDGRLPASSTYSMKCRR
jgi:hypothetical protein